MIIDWITYTAECISKFKWQTPTKKAVIKYRDVIIRGDGQLSFFSINMYSFFLSDYFPFIFPPDGPDEIFSIPFVN